MTYGRRHWHLAGPVTAAGLGAASAAGTAMLLQPARDWLGNANVALVLVVVIVAAGAIGGRLAGATTAATAAIAFNAIHTRPYGSLAIDRREDIVSTVLLVAVGLAVGEITQHRLRSQRDARHRRYTVQRVHHVAELVATGAPLDDLVTAIDTELCAELDLASTRFTLATTEGAGVALHHNAQLLDASGDPTDHLPPEGADLAVHHHGRVVGHLRLTPRRRTHVTHEQRVLAITLADLLGATIPDPGSFAPGRPRQTLDAARNAAR